MDVCLNSLRSVQPISSWTNTVASTLRLPGLAVFHTWLGLSFADAIGMVLMIGPSRARNAKSGVTDWLGVSCQAGCGRG
jgi:hypothetical protein